MENEREETKRELDYLERVVRDVYPRSCDISSLKHSALQKHKHVH